MILIQRNCVIQHDTIQCDTIQCDTIWCDNTAPVIQFDGMQCDRIECDTMQSCVYDTHVYNVTQYCYSVVQYNVTQCE